MTTNFALDSSLLSRENSLSATTSMDLATYLEEFSEYDCVYSEDKPPREQATGPVRESFDSLKDSHKDGLKVGLLTEVAPCEGYRVVEFGMPGTLQYRALLLNSKGVEVSPWNDLPLYHDRYLHIVCKTPKGSWVEYETARTEPFNPLKIKSWVDSPAHFSENAPFNLGMLPQTWSDPHDSLSGHPLEVIDIGSRISHTGEVYLVKPLGSFAVMDTGAHASWKIIAIGVADECAPLLNDVSDVEKHKPGLLKDIREWLRTCHSIDPSCKGKLYGLNETAASLKSANELVSEAHKAWKSTKAQGSCKEGWNLLLPRPIASGIYETMWKLYTAAGSTTRIPLSDSIKGCTSRYERAWIDTYSPKYSDDLFSLTSPRVKLAATILSWPLQKQVARVTKAELWRSKFCEALDKQDSPKITFSSALMNYTKQNILMNPPNGRSSLGSLMERRKGQSSEMVLAIKKDGVAVMDEPLHNHRRYKSLSRFGQFSSQQSSGEVEADFVDLKSPRLPAVPKSSRVLKSTHHKPQVTTTKNLKERIQQQTNRVVCQGDVC